MSMWFHENKNDNLFISCDVNEIRKENKKYNNVKSQFSENEFFNCLVDYYILAHSDKIYHINNSTFAKAAALYNNTLIVDLNKNLIFNYINDKNFKIQVGLNIQLSNVFFYPCNNEPCTSFLYWSKSSICFSV